MCDKTWGPCSSVNDRFGRWGFLKGGSRPKNLGMKAEKFGDIYICACICEIWGWWKFSEQCQISPLNIWGGYFAPYEKNSPPKWQLHTRCGGHSCRRSVHEFMSAWVHESAHLLCHAPSTGSSSQFCLILHPHRVAIPFPPSFASPWRNSFVQVHMEQLCSRQSLGPPLPKRPKNDQNWAVGHLLVQPPPLWETFRVISHMNEACHEQMSHLKYELVTSRMRYIQQHL